MSADAKTAAWLPYSVVEAAHGDDDASSGDLASTWHHLLDQLKSASDLVLADGSGLNERDVAAGMRHLLVLLALGIDAALRFDPDPVPAVRAASTDDALTWGMECPDCIYYQAGLRAGESYRLFGNRGTARYVGLQTMDGISATANVLVDELDVDPDGNFEIVLSAQEHPGNWMPLAGQHPTLTVRHFFYDWDAEVPSSLQLETLSESASGVRAAVPVEKTVPKQLTAIGDFVFDNLKFFLQFGEAPPLNGFLPPADFSSMGAAAENRPVIGRWGLQPDEALILEVEPPEGVYWSFSLGNHWWETIHYGRHQSSLNGHQASVDSDGKVRVVISTQDPGIANWLDTTGLSAGAMILRCVRTETAPTPTAKVVKIDELAAALPTDTRTVSPAERARVLGARRRAVDERFS